MELQGQVEHLRKKGLGLAAISYDSTEILADFSKQHGITYPLLSDVNSATIKRYGILNTVALEALGPNAQDPAVAADIRVYATVLAPSERYRGIPFPGTFIVDREGLVTSRFFEEFYRERRTVANMMLTLGDGIGATVQGARVSTRHLDMQVYPSDASISVGNRVSLVLDITPRPGMHVYAPGAKGYRVITLTVAPEPFVKALPLKYPASEVYFFEPLNERVPVFQKRFTLLQDVIPDASPEAQVALRDKGTLTLNGALEYQACDEKTCFNPVSLPVSWTLALKPMVVPQPGKQ